MYTVGRIISNDQRPLPKALLAEISIVWPHRTTKFNKNARILTIEIIDCSTWEESKQAIDQFLSVIGETANHIHKIQADLIFDVAISNEDWREPHLKVECDVEFLTRLCNYGAVLWLSMYFGYERL